jgi:hypothetical protein
MAKRVCQKFRSVAKKKSLDPLQKRKVASSIACDGMREFWLRWGKEEVCMLMPEAKVMKL